MEPSICFETRFLNKASDFKTHVRYYSIKGQRTEAKQPKVMQVLDELPEHRYNASFSVLSHINAAEQNTKNEIQ